MKDFQDFESASSDACSTCRLRMAVIPLVRICSNSGRMNPSSAAGFFFRDIIGLDADADRRREVVWVAAQAPYAALDLPGAWLARIRRQDHDGYRVRSLQRKRLQLRRW